MNKYKTDITGVSKVLIPIILTLLILIFAKPIYGTTDDYILKSWLDGSYTGKSEKESIFITSIFSYILGFLYSNIPSISWYGISLLLVSLASIIYLYLYTNSNYNMSKNVKYFNFVILGAYLTWSILGITYTATAIIAGVAGWVSFKEWLYSNSKRALFIALLFVIISISVRPESFAGATLIIYPLILFRLKIDKSQFLKIVLFLSLVFSILFLNRFIENSSSSEMKDYRNWAKKVQMFAGRPRMDAALQVLGNSGWTASEYHLFSDLAYFDNKKFNPKWIEDGIIATDKISNRPALSIDKIKSIATEYFNSISVFGYALVFIILSLVIFRREIHSPLAVWYLILNFTLIHLFNGLFLHNVPRVTIPFVIGLLFIISHFVKFESKNRSSLIALTALLVIFVSFFVQQNNANNKKIVSAEIYRSSIVIERKDKIVLINGNQEYFHYSNPFFGVTKDPDPNVFMVGNWDTFSPHWFKRAKLVGLNENNLVESLLTNKSVYWAGPTVPNTTLNLINYLNECGYDVSEPVKIGLLPNGNELWTFAMQE